MLQKKRIGLIGIHTLEQGGLRTTLINAVEAATKRSKKLDQMMVKDFIKNHKNGK